MIQKAENILQNDDWYSQKGNRKYYNHKKQDGILTQEPSKNKKDLLEIKKKKW